MSEMNNHSLVFGLGLRHSRRHCRHGKHMYVVYIRYLMRAMLFSAAAAAVGCAVHPCAKTGR